MTPKSPQQRPLRVAVVQQACSTEKGANVAQTLDAIDAAAQAGAQLICLQELFASRYFCQREDHQFFELAEPLPGPTLDQIAAAARARKVVVVASLFERRAAGLYHNTAAVLDADGSIAGVYRKMHIPDDPYYYEKFYFTPGDLGFRAIDTSLGRIGVCICWDQWFPEAARLTALHGAELLVYPTAIGWLAEDKPTYGAAQRNAWQTMMRSHAIANGVFVAAPNRCGVEDDIEFWGTSFVCDPYGNVLVQAGEQPEILLAECDLGLLDVARTHWPFLRDRRVDAYGGLTSRYLDSSERTGR